MATRSMPRRRRWICRSVGERGIRCSGVPRACWCVVREEALPWQTSVALASCSTSCLALSRWPSVRRRLSSTIAGSWCARRALASCWACLGTSRLLSTLRASLPCGLLTGTFAVLRVLRLHALVSRRALLVRCGWSVAMLPFCAWRIRPSCWPVWSRRLRLSR